MPFNPKSRRNLMQYRGQQSGNSSPANDGHSSVIPMPGKSASDAGAESVENRGMLPASAVGCAPENQPLTRMEPTAAAREMLKQAAPSVAEKLLRLTNMRGLDPRVQLAAIRTALEAAGVLQAPPALSPREQELARIMPAIMALGRALGKLPPVTVEGAVTDAHITTPAS